MRIVSLRKDVGKRDVEKGRGKGKGKVESPVRRLFEVDSLRGAGFFGPRGPKERRADAETGGENCCARFRNPKGEEGRWRVGRIADVRLENAEKRLAASLAPLLITPALRHRISRVDE
ncbi:hypothetical protein KM043_007319 [Ampulex compressa]|nr:hypothetical protein KM043_007319 [Ampulex compressa]